MLLYFSLLICVGCLSSLVDTDETVFTFEKEVIWEEDFTEIETVKTDLETPPKIWGLLVAGSNGWYNYRHQADVCHAYQVLHAHGIPDEQIVVMMYDDIANNTENPDPGRVYNRPNGTDVYHGVLRDYVGKDVTPENFLNVLQGNARLMAGVGTGKVINSGPNDHIFVNMVDHGAPGIFAFPSTMLKATALIGTLKSMHKAKKYKQMVIYMEACESGSMFSKLLPKHWNVYATTAANTHESSYACYYSDAMKTYLGDVYSVKWMEDSDKENLHDETLQKQFEIVKQETNTSHVMEYGDMRLEDDTLDGFQGEGTSTHAPKYDHIPLYPVASEEVPLSILKHRLLATNDAVQRRDIHKQIETMLIEREHISDQVKHIISFSSSHHTQSTRILTSHLDLNDHTCYEQIVDRYSDACHHGKLAQNHYAMKQLYAFVNLCEERISADTIIDAIEKVCELDDY